MSSDWHEKQEIEKAGSIETFTGRRFKPIDPNPININIRDIAHSLSMNCRYNGHCSRFYSVAEHSVLMSSYLYDMGWDWETQIWALLHDASEAYLPDMPRPIKGLVNGFDEAEERIQRAIAMRFNLSWPIPEIVHVCDDGILADEARQLIRSGGEDWYLPEDSLGIEVFCWSPQTAYMKFIDRYLELQEHV